MVQRSTTPGTDVDRFIAQHRDTWHHLEGLAKRAQRDVGRLSADELDELVRLHLRVSSHLSTVRTELHDPDLAAWLSQLVARSSALVHGTRPRTWRAFLHGVTDVFPAAVWHVRVPILVATLLFVAVAGGVGTWLATSDAALELAFPEEVRQSYLERDFEAYYSAEPGTTFAARVFTNNAAVGALAFAAGVLWGVPTILILVFNALNVSVAIGVFHAAGEGAHMWGLLLPHGLLELSAVFIAAGAGLALGWSVIAPGDRARSEAVAEQGRRSIVLVVGLVGVFLVAGLLEGYVTPRDWPAVARVGVGAVVWLAVLGYLGVRGRAAASRGLTGLPGEEDPRLRAARRA